MKYLEKYQDLFSVDDRYYLAHCISADFALGKGIAVQFARKYSMKHKLRHIYPNSLVNEWEGARDAKCILIDKVFNLVTKKEYWSKPTYYSMRTALELMKEEAVKVGVKKIAMPKIGCGLDRLEWEAVSKMIQEIFQDTDIEILICKF